MSLKFNCSNPGCRQRLEVDDDMAGTALICPVCRTELRVPGSHDIRFDCRKPACQQHLVVDVSEAGRVVRCPSCGTLSRVPGDPPKLWLPQRTGTAAEQSPPGKRRVLARWRAAARLVTGWGVGAILLGLLSAGFHWVRSARMPEHLDEMADEIHHRFYPEPSAPLPPAVFSRDVAVVNRTATNAGGESFEYYYVPPAKASPGRKYPVVVDQSSSIRKRRMRDIQFLANAGIFYVSPNAYGITNWGVVPGVDNVLATLSDMARVPGVDANRFYVMGQSATAVAAVELVNAYPQRWRGVLLLEPGGAFPRIPFAVARAPSVFISHGIDDRFNEGPLGRPGLAEQFLMQASLHLVPVWVDYQDGGHGYPPDQLQQAYLDAARFILMDY